jgi:hypothetical protein
MLTQESREKAKEARRAKPTRREKMANFGETFAVQRREFPRMALSIISQAEKGSLPAAIKLMCLDCCCWERKEIRDCVIVGCPLYPHRPYQPSPATSAQSSGASAGLDKECCGP